MGVVIPQVVTEDRASGAQIIDGGLRFTGSSYLQRTPTTAGNTTTYTISCWVKRSHLAPDGSGNTNSNANPIFAAGTNAGSDVDELQFYKDGGGNNNQLRFLAYPGAFRFDLFTSMVFRDTSSWYHIVANYDGTTAKIYVNGTQVTNFASSTQNGGAGNINTTDLHTIGVSANATTAYMRGYLSQFYFIDGQALDSSYFGYTDPLTNTWRPKKYKNTTTLPGDSGGAVGFGTNGFWLPFDGSAPIGQDQSGRGNNWTPVNFGGSNTIEKATGALPILNTDGGGKVARVGVRTDSNASSLVLALPLVGIKSDFSNAVNSGTTEKVVTNYNSNAVFTSAYSNFYGGSVQTSNTNTGSSDANAKVLQIASNSDFSFTGDFTVETWIYATAIESYAAICGNYATVNDFYIEYSTERGLLVGFNNATYSGSYTAVANVWKHIAVTRSGSTLRIFVDGVQTNSHTASGTIAAQDFGIGGLHNRARGFEGYIQDFRIYKGTAKYTQNFIPASTDPDILPDTPSGVAYSSNVALVPSTDGAVAFDGSGDYLTTVSSNDFGFGTGDFTLEYYLYPTSLSSTYHPNFVVGTTGGIWVGKLSSNFSVHTLDSTTLINYSTLPTLNKWTHIAVSRSGTTLRLFYDGVQVASTTSSYNFASGVAYIGNDTSTNYTDGFISNLHVVKGTALYTSNFTPPTAPITSVANTKLLCCKSNSSAIFGDITPTATDNYSAGVALTATTYTDIGGSNCTITNNGSVTSSSAGTNSFGLTNAADMTGTQRVDINMGNVSSTFFQSAWTLEMFFKTSSTSDGNWFVGTAQEGAVWQTGWAIQYQSGSLQWSYDSPAGGTQKSLGIALSSNTWYFMRVQRTPGSSTALNVWVYDSPTNLVGSFSGTVSDTSTQTQNTLKIGDANGNSNNLTANWQFANVMLTAGTVAYQNVPTLSGGVRTDNASVSTQLILNGNVAPSNFNPFTVNINTQRGQESGYATLNPLEKGSSLTLSNGNLQVDASGSSISNMTKSTIGVSTGKWYYEVTVNTNTNANAYFGVGLSTASFATYPGQNAQSWAFGPWSGSYYTIINGSFVNPTYTGNTSTGTFGVALDAGTGAMWYRSNTGMFVTGNPEVGTSPTISGITSTSTLFPIVGHYSVASQTTQQIINFGQKPFKFPPPAGFQPLALANTPRPTIVRPDQYVGVSTWSGAQSGSGGLTRQISTVFQPDFVWIKQRNQSFSTGHQLYDSVRGAGAEKELNSSGTAAEGAGNIETYGWLNSFDKTGFTVKGGSTDYDYVDKTGTNYVAWAWKAGGNSNTYNINDVGYATTTAAGLTAGTNTITGASVNTKSGFSIITYTLGSNNCTYPHGLGTQPSFMITKPRNATTNWTIYHRSLGRTYYGIFDSTQFYNDVSNVWGTSEPDSTVFGVNGNLYSNGGYNMISYIWAEIPGFSKFGSYTGNNSTDGPVIITGFRPRFIMIKSTGSADRWTIQDTSRDSYNPSINTLSPNLSNVELTTSFDLDITSNGFKIRNTNSGHNTLSGTYIYAAFAETPSFNLYGGQSNAR